ncbi:Outer dense fiber protein 2-like [Gossypium arboreum]|uniref:Outer dense fiber protein 2-like n=1 Tax=Gossypium arboreum TaxID=29729 RepID=A0A0B0NM66_GOSAR|nr:Outer dense fiber protein 2-like [Gossypium arboreum]KHG13925.1 Outer dense fiber protein 2-like [Gossypium arboreum]
MRTKRKRACKKSPARKSAAVARNGKATNQSEKAVNQNKEAFLTSINKINKEDSVSADSNDLEVIDKCDSDPDDAKRNSSSSSTSSDSDESFSAEDSSSGDSQSIDRRSRKSTKGHGNGKQKASKLPKKGRKDDVKSSKLLRSSGKRQDEFKMPQQDPRYNKKELEAALEVIKKIMKMDEAQPFNVPVDPVASGKPVMGTSYKPSTTDYATRHSGLEPFYQVSSAVGGASQMQQDQLGFSQPYGYMPPFSYSQPHQLPQTTPSTSWPQFSHLPPVSYHQHCQSQHPQPSTNQSQFSQLQACTGCNNAGYSHLQPHKEIAPKHKKHEPLSKHKKNAAMAPAASICGGAPSDSHAQQPQLSNKQPYFLRQRQSISPLQPSQLHDAADGDIAPKHKKHASMSKHRKNSSMNPVASIHGGPPGHSQTQLQAVVNGVKLHLPPQADYTRSSGYVPLYPVDSMAVLGQSHPQQSPLSRSESSEPQQLHPKASHCQPQSSQLQDNLDIEYSHMSLTDSALRGIRCALEYSARPTTNKSNKANQDQVASVNLQPDQTPQSPEHPQRITKKKRGRGPTRCRFLNDLADGERIFVHFNKFGQPVGPESSKLSSFLGTIARNGHKAPLNFVHWRAMPDSYKEEMWEYTKFALDPSGKSWVMQSIATKWRNWKADLKATYYDSLKTDEERLKVLDPRVVPDQWPSLISYWSSDDTKKHCATNRANRLKQRSGHSSGTKSYARILEEESKIREQEAKKETTSQCSDESNDTLCRVMGEENHNRVRPYRMRSTCTDLFGPISSRDDLVRMASEAKKSADEKVRKMVVKMEAMEEKYARMENHIARMTSSMEKFLKKVGGSSNTLGLEQAAEPEEDDA